MSEAPADPRCPECGEPIGQTATYCMHCSADLTEEQEAADPDGDEVWEQTATEATSSIQERADSIGRSASSTQEDSGELLDPDGVVDNTLTVIVGVVGGIVVGTVGTVVLGVLTGSGWAVLFGLVTWLGATAYLVRRRTVQGAISKSGYAVALVLLLVPVIAFSPAMDINGGVGERGGVFLVMLAFVAVPAGIAAVIGWIASRFVPENAAGSEG